MHSAPSSFSHSLLGLLVVSLLSATASASPKPEKTKGPESCAECHKLEVEAWKQTLHFKTFNEMHRKPEAQQIAEKMGVRRLKSESLCLQCHYTGQMIAGKLEVNFGTSCESCHGAAVDWIDVHNNYGPGGKKETENAEHRTKRLADAKAAGMIHPSDLYAVASNCYSCHIVTDEKLVNVGGHSTGSAEFDLVAYSQGEVRHNFFRTDGKSNPEEPVEQRRRLFVIGTLLDLEYTLRAVARSTEKATYGVTMARRAAGLKKKLADIQAAAPIEEIAAAIAVVDGVGLKLNNAAELNGAADKVAVEAKKFSAKSAGADLKSLDSMIAGPDKFKGKPFKVGGG